MIFLLSFSFRRFCPYLADIIYCYFMRIFQDFFPF